MSEFHIVSDDRRRSALTGPHATHPLWDAIRSGKTVFVPGRTGADYAGSRTNLRRQGYRLFTRQETNPRGVVLWAERIEA